MKKLEVLAKAKVNLSLDIVGKDGGFHELKTVVSAIDFGDKIVIKKRNDDRISLKVVGSAGCSADENNAFKAGKVFKKTFRTSGFDILLKKKIPVGGGLGGSSADSAGALKGLKTLFGIEGDIATLSDALGSDTKYMLNGGFALLEGRGDKITPIDTDLKLYLILCIADGSVITKNAFKAYDEAGETFKDSSDKMLAAVKKGDADGVIKNLKNDLFPSACTLLPEVKKNFETMAKHYPTVMSGSGATVYSVFKTKKERDSAYKVLSRTLKGKLVKAETV